jgi:hypothetical protein
MLLSIAGVTPGVSSNEALNYAIGSFSIPHVFANLQASQTDMINMMCRNAALILLLKDSTNGISQGTPGEMYSMPVPLPTHYYWRARAIPPPVHYPCECVLELETCSAVPPRY